MSRAAARPAGARGGRLSPLRLAFWLLLATIIICGSAIGVNAWSMQAVSQHNYLQSHQVGVIIEEVFPVDSISPGSTLTKEISFTNTGSAPLFLRIAYAEIWENGEKWLEDDGTNCIKNWTGAFSSDWQKIDDWYYYQKVLPAGGNTGDILAGITFSEELPEKYANGKYTLDFIVEAVQLSADNAVNAQATQQVFGVKAKVTNTTISNGAVTDGTVTWGKGGNEDE